MVEIDVAHARLIHGLITASKPETILEFGFGGGRSHNAIASAALFNQNKPAYTLVDSWHDWNGQMPDAVHATIKRHSLNHVSKEHPENTFGSFAVHSSTEEHFVRHAIGAGWTYDFIMSDADHQHSHEWAKDVFDKMLNVNGFLIYHDVDGSYPGLRELVSSPGEFGFMPEWSNHMSFFKSTRPDEECKRGLLVIQKK